jgi:site-specific recombinase XerD
VSFADRAVKRPPRTLTEDEQTRLLKVSGEHRDGFRDHVIFSIALATALREHEIAALDVGDVSDDPFEGTVKRTIELRVFKRSRRGKKSAPPDDQYVRLSDAAFYKLSKYLKMMFRDRGFRPASNHPLFWARPPRHGWKSKPRRLSTRRLRELFAEWQRRAGFEKIHNFHVLRHTAISNVYRKTKNIRVAQRVGRHADIATTTRYEHASDEDVARAVKDLKS